MSAAAIRAIEIFADRHWLIGFQNELLTLVIGLGLVRLIMRIAGDWLRPSHRSSLVRIVLLISLYKGALYFVLGESLFVGKPWHFVPAFQWPDIREVFYLIPQTRNSIWKPAPLTAEVSVFLCGYALLCLVGRALDIERKKRIVAAHLSEPNDDEADLIDTTLIQASAAIQRPKLARIPVQVTAEHYGRNLYVLGLSRPSIVIDRATLHEMHAEGCLEVALRHELMHIARGDNVVRWVQTWLRDVAILNLISRPINNRAMELEEDLCDAGAIKTRPDALLLAKALTIASQDSGNLGRTALQPAFVGDKLFEARTIKDRLTFIYAQVVSTSPSANSQKPPFWNAAPTVAVRLLIISLLVIVLLFLLYTKFHIFWMVPQY